MSEVSLGHPQSASRRERAEATKISNLKLAVWLYLATEVVIFTVLIATYVVFRVNNAELVREVQNEMNVSLVGFNTFLLLTSSWAMVRGLLAVQRGNRRGLVNWFLLMCALGVIFVSLQYVEYQELAYHDIAIYNNPFGMRFYALTAFHGFHVIVGVVWGLWVIRRAMQGAYEPNYVGVEVFGLYWHFVDVVWIFLFTLLYLI